LCGGCLTAADTRRTRQATARYQEACKGKKATRLHAPCTARSHDHHLRRRLAYRLAAAANQPLETRRQYSPVVDEKIGMPCGLYSLGSSLSAFDGRRHPYHHTSPIHHTTHGWSLSVPGVGSSATARSKAKNKHKCKNSQGRMLSPFSKLRRPSVSCSC
jgi:hypothetical protein